MSQLGSLGQKNEYELGTGEVLWSPLSWEHGAQPVAAFAQSQILDEGGQPLEYWIELKGRKVLLSGDRELMQGEVETFPDLFSAAAAANAIERKHLAAPPRLFPSPTQPAGESGKEPRS